MTEREFKTLIDSIRDLATATEDAAFDLAPTITPADTARLIAWVAELNKMIETIEDGKTPNFASVTTSPPSNSGYRH